MPDISLTDFVDFAIKTPASQFTKVRQIYSRGSYEPKFDFWKALREGIQDVHEKNKKLDGVLDKITDAKKTPRYASAVKSYDKFISKQKGLAWFKPPVAVWTYSELNVRINPELGLVLDGQKHVVKLYFKDENPTKQRLEFVFAMMRIGLQLGSVTLPAVLDVSKGKIIVPKSMGEDLLPLLQAQALAFVHLWKAIDAKNPTSF